jgi:hypothetical protein
VISYLLLWQLFNLFLKRKKRILHGVFYFPYFITENNFNFYLDESYNLDVVPLLVNFIFTYSSKESCFFNKNYFYDFFNELPEAAKEKTDYVLFVVQYAERIPVNFSSILRV